MLEIFFGHCIVFKCLLCNLVVYTKTYDIKQNCQLFCFTDEKKLFAVTTIRVRFLIVPGKLIGSNFSVKSDSIVFQEERERGGGGGWSLKGSDFVGGRCGQRTRRKKVYFLTKLKVVLSVQAFNALWQGMLKSMQWRIILTSSIGCPFPTLKWFILCPIFPFEFSVITERLDLEQYEDRCPEIQAVNSSRFLCWAMTEKPENLT